MQNVGKLLGGVSTSELCEKILKGKDVSEMEDRIETLSGQVESLQKQLDRKNAEQRTEKVFSAESAETLRRVRKLIGFPGDVLNKAKLYDEEVHKAGPGAASKVVGVLVEFGERMEKTLFEIRDALQASGLYPEPDPEREVVTEKERTPAKGIKIGSPTGSVKPKEKPKEEFKTPKSKNPVSRVESETGKESTPGSQTRGQQKQKEESEQGTPQSKMSDPSPKGTAKRKKTAKRARETSPIELGSEAEEDLPKRAEEEDSEADLPSEEESSDGEDSESAITSPKRGKGGKVIPTPSKSKTPAKTNRKQPARRGAAKHEDSPSKRVKK